MYIAYEVTIVIMYIVLYKGELGGGNKDIK